MSEAHIKGVTVELDGEEFVVPPLKIGAMVELADDIELVGKEDAEKDIGDHFRAVARVIHAALKRNYAHLTEDAVYQKLDLATWRPAWRAAMVVSGLEQTGETQPAADVNGSAMPSAASAQALPPGSAGATGE